MLNFRLKVVVLIVGLYKKLCEIYHLELPINRSINLIDLLKSIRLIQINQID